MIKSPLTQGRELKHARGAQNRRKQRSPLTQGRELKRLHPTDKADDDYVAPHAGA